MAEVLLVGAVVGAAFGELLQVVVDVGKKIVMFKSELKLLQSTLISIQPMFGEIERMNTVLNRPKRETDMFVDRLRAGKDLVLKCSRIPSWNHFRRYVYAKKMIDLDKSLLRFFQMDVQAQVACDTKKTLVEMRDHSDKLDQMLSIMKNGGGEVRSSSGFAGCCGVPGLPDLIVGLDKPLRDLKEMLLGDGVSEVLISAPGGSGKTTLAQMLCHDKEIKGKFGERLFVTVSKMADLQGIIRKIFEHKGIKKHEFQSEEDAIRQLEQLMKQLVQEKGSILLVLDDVWSTWKSRIESFRFWIPSYTILVTSRFEFKRFDFIYKLNILEDKDADALFRHSAFRGDDNSNIPDNLVNKIVQGCKGVPLALIVVGRSLYGQHEVKWRSVLKKWSKGQSIFDKDDELLLRLKTSLDDLDEMAIIKECFLDLGAFPEDETIQSTILMDMWAELYNLEDEDMETLGNLLELSFRNLINLVRRRGDAVGMDDYCDEYVIMQHDLLRELAIHQSSLKPIEYRERLIIDISGNNLPVWWIEQRHQTIHARLLSIFTDEKFSSWYDMQVPKVEVLILNFRTAENYTLPHFMERMDQLKVLIIKCCGAPSAELNSFPVGGYLSSLRRIRLEKVSISSLGTSLMQMRNLRKMSLIWCNIVKAFEKRTSEIPQHMLPNLVEVELEYCLNTVELLDGLCNIVNLKKLSVSLNGMKALPEVIGRMTNLEVLRLSWCVVLEELPEWIGNLHKLRLLDISFCARIIRMPERMGELCCLTTLDMRGCISLLELPTSIKDLRDLEYVICDEQIAHQWEFYKTRLANLKLSVSLSSEMYALPNGIRTMTNLVELRLRCCTYVKELPEFIGNLHKLRLLDISFCSEITRLPERMGELCSLKTLDMRGCRKLKALPASVKDLRDLEYVICDDQIAHQWEFHKTHLPNLKITAVNMLLHERS